MVTRNSVFVDLEMVKSLGEDTKNQLDNKIQKLEERAPEQMCIYLDQFDSILKLLFNCSLSHFGIY